MEKHACECCARRSPRKQDLLLTIQSCDGPRRLSRWIPSSIFESSFGDVEIYCLIGEDNVAGLSRWHRFDELKRMVKFVVLNRTGRGPAHSYRTVARLIDISATDIRKRVASGRSIRYLGTNGSGDDYPPGETLQGAKAITAEQLAASCAEFASAKKAEEIVVLDLRGISTFTDFFVICSATSEPQLKAIAGEIEGRLRDEYRIKPAAMDGFPASQWIVLDYLQVVVHIFHQEKRPFTASRIFGATPPAWTGRRWWQRRIAPNDSVSGEGVRLARRLRRLAATNSVAQFGAMARRHRGVRGARPPQTIFRPAGPKRPARES